MHSIQVMVSLTFILDFRLLSTDVNQASKIIQLNQRKMFVKPCPQFGLNSSKILKLQKLLHGLAEEENYQNRKLRINLIQESK